MLGPWRKRTSAAGCGSAKGLAADGARHGHVPAQRLRASSCALGDVEMARRTAGDIGVADAIRVAADVASTDRGYRQSRPPGAE